MNRLRFTVQEVQKVQREQQTRLDEQAVLLAQQMALLEKQNAVLLQQGELLRKERKECACMREHPDYFARKRSRSRSPAGVDVD